MSDFAVLVETVADVVDHPNADRLSIVKIRGYDCIAAKLESGAHRYQPGDYVVYVPEDAVVPEYLLKRGFWSEKDGKGLLAGKKGDRVKAVKLRGIFSQGILFPVEDADYWEKDCLVVGETERFLACPGEDVAERLGVVKHVPEIPVGMDGEICAVAEIPRYDFDSLQKLPDLFTPGESVVATEKLHGTFINFGLIPGLENPDLFGGGAASVYVTSKGYGAKGLAFKNKEANANNLYVRVLTGLLATQDIGHKMLALSALFDNAPVYVFGEVFGRGVQDLHYGQDKPAFRMFDLRVGYDFLPPAEMAKIAEIWGIETVPELYRGPFDLEVLEGLREGQDTLSNSHVREGVVVRAAQEARHPIHGRKIGKLVGQGYLLRKGENLTEYQ